MEPDGRFDVTLRIPGGEVRPGLINAHEHLHRNHYGRLGAPPYPNAYAWGRDIHARAAAEIAAGRARAPARGPAARRVEEPVRRRDHRRAPRRVGAGLRARLSAPRGPRARHPLARLRARDGARRRGGCRPSAAPSLRAPGRGRRRALRPRGARPGRPRPAGRAADRRARRGAGRGRRRAIARVRRRRGVVPDLQPVPLRPHGARGAAGARDGRASSAATRCSPATATCWTSFAPPAASACWTTRACWMPSAPPPPAAWACPIPSLEPGAPADLAVFRRPVLACHRRRRRAGDGGWPSSASPIPPSAPRSTRSVLAPMTIGGVTRRVSAPNA